MARGKPKLADRMEAGYFQKTDSTEVPISQESPVERAKRTYYLPTDTIMLLDELQLARFKETGKKPDLSDLVDEGIKLLAETRQAS